MPAGCVPGSLVAGSAAATLSALFALAIPLAMPAFAQEVPVMVGADGLDWDACGALGRVEGLDPSGDTFLAVRAGPSTDHAKIDEVYAGDVLNVCEARGRWLGVVYDATGATGDCGVSTPLPRQPYGGPCRAGWVFDGYVAVIAG